MGFGNVEASENIYWKPGADLQILHGGGGTILECVSKNIVSIIILFLMSFFCLAHIIRMRNASIEYKMNKTEVSKGRGAVHLSSSPSDLPLLETRLDEQS